MKFRTEYTAVPSDIRLGLDTPLAMMGSCFTEYMGERLRKFLWNAANPSGVLFNPLSIARVLGLLSDRCDAPAIIDESAFFDGKMWHSWLADTSFSGHDKEEVCRKTEASIAELDKLLTAGRTLIVTFGTAWCYFLGNNVVANCHKQPAALFSRRLVDIDTITGIWRETIKALQTRYDGLNIIFTVSPVRHVRDGLAENSRSKAVLLLAVDRLCREFDNCSYFPAYEILMDDLRDYRFYSADLVHPSGQAVEYIQEKFCDTYVSAAEMEILKSGESVYRRLHHRPISPGTPEAEEFRKQSLSIYRSFIADHPNALRL